MIKIGDKVKFLNAVGGGVVTSFSGKNMVNVENDEGFEIPTMISQLILAEPKELDESAAKAENKTVPSRTGDTRNVEAQSESLVIDPAGTPSFFLAFLPENQSNPIGGDVKVYLINACTYSLLYHFSHSLEGEFVSVAAGMLNPGSKMFLEALGQQDLNNLPDFYFQLMFFKDRASQCEVPIYKRIRVNPVKFYKNNSFQKNAFFSGAALLIPIDSSDLEDELRDLTDREIKKVIREKQEPKAKKRRTDTPELIEIDLHIDELLDDTRGLSNHEMLEIQMKTFHEELQRAIETGVKRIVFIHGLGNGTLKQELRKELSQKFKKYAFQDASFQEYGFGATMVLLKK